MKPTIEKMGLGSLIASDLAALQNNRGGLLRAFFMHPGFAVVLFYRLARSLQQGSLWEQKLAKLVCRIACFFSACQLSHKADIGSGLYIPHPVGIIIGEGAAIGDRVTIYQNVTIGQRQARENSTNLSYPILGDDVVIGAGAVIIGGITIGNKARIGANAVVLQNVPEGATAVGVPARIISQTL